MAKERARRTPWQVVLPLLAGAWFALSRPAALPTSNSGDAQGPSGATLWAFGQELLAARAAAQQLGPGDHGGDYAAGLRLFTAAAPKPFWMAIPTDERAGVAAMNVNEALWRDGAWDVLEERVVKAVLHRRCTRGGLMLDLGSNTGWFSLLALAHGCSVTAVDGSQGALAYLRASVALNGWAGRAQLLHRLVSDEQDVAFDGWRVTQAGGARGATPVEDSATPGTVRMADLVAPGAQVAYMKVDVVGHEPSAFKSGASLFTPGKATVLNLLFEFTYKLNNASTWEAYTQHVWEPLWLAGYRCWALGLSTEASKPNFAAMRERLRAQCADAPTCGLNVYCTLQDFEIGEQAMQ